MRRAPSSAVALKRVYEPAAEADGRRFLVERLWPRGIKKTDLKMEAWLKEVAPSAKLRTWFAHDPGKWPEFQRRYRAELDAAPEAWRALLEASKSGNVTLLFSSRETEHNCAVVLREFLEERRR
ncbi:DUF488 domain-containing protein [Opitutaceae bacterium EW11]|nr:DUF488 domain-containing protein [Opitutaceae bacterium EW11]